MYEAYFDIFLWSITRKRMHGFSEALRSFVTNQKHNSYVSINQRRKHDDLR